MKTLWASRLLVGTMLLGFGACRCDDELGAAPPWSVEETAELPDLDMDLPDPPDLPALPDTSPPRPDMAKEEQTIVPVSTSVAQTDRSSLGIGQDERVWVGFHRCRTTRCLTPLLSVAQISNQTNQPIQVEDLLPQDTTFGLEVLGNVPWVSFLDTENARFGVASREGEDAWFIFPGPVNYTGNFDGLDMSAQGQQMYITYASGANDWIDLLVHNPTGGAPPAGSLLPLDRLKVDDPTAALERGLRTDAQGNLYLVHRDQGVYGVAKYDLAKERWTQRAYVQDPDLIVSALLVRQDGQLCLSYTRAPVEFLQVSCGSMEDLEARVWTFENRLRVHSYSSIVQAPDGRLVVVYTALNRSALRLAILDPRTDDPPQIVTLYEGFASGVSAAVDGQGRLAISYYKCEGNRNCQLSFLRLSEY